MTGLPEPIRILSDLHLGYQGGTITDIEALRPILEGAGTIVFNGDTLEERKIAFQERSNALFTDLQSLCQDLGAKTVFLSGNHDPSFPPHRHLDLADGRVFVSHGDVLYKNLSPWSHFAQHAADAADRIRTDYTAEELETLETQLEITNRTALEMEIPFVPALRGFTGFLKKWCIECWPPTRPFIILDTWRTAAARAHRFREKHRPNARVFLVGHTHLPFCSQRRGNWAINTGAFVSPAYARSVDLVGNDLSVRRIHRTGGHFQPGAEILTVTV